MAELNFNALARPGPRGFMQGYEQGQEQRMVQEPIKLRKTLAGLNLMSLNATVKKCCNFKRNLKV